MSKIKHWQLPQEQQDRLVQIALEHTQLAREFVCDRRTITAARKEQIWKRIEELRVERVAMFGR